MHLWINATGLGAGLLSGRLTGSSVPFFRCMPVPLNQLAGLLLSADAHLIRLKDAFVGFVMPSKVYAILELRRPLLSWAVRPRMSINLVVTENQNQI